jgi:endonuclease III
MAYLDLKSKLIERGYEWEVDWQESVMNAPIDEPTFLRESAWVVLCSGMRESVVRKHFRAISIAFLEWADAASIVYRSETCSREALSVFNSRRKIDAIVSIATVVMKRGFESIERQLATDTAADYLQSLPQLGPVTARHLLKNLGRPIAKPDRHLARLSRRLGYSDALELCASISRIVGDSVAVVDIVLWRAAALEITGDLIATNHEAN